MKNQTSKVKTRDPVSKQRKPGWIYGNKKSLEAIRALTENIDAVQVTSKYTPVQTSEVHKQLVKLGWRINKSAISNKDCKYSKHVLVYTHSKHKTESGNEIRIIVSNSFNGTSSFNISIGVFRSVSSNGIIMASRKFGAINKRHMAINVDQIPGLVKEQLAAINPILAKINLMQTKKLTKNQKISLAERLVDSAPISKIFNISIDSVLKPQRKEDRKSDLWTVFNIVQENLTGGGLHVISKKTEKPWLTKPTSNAFADIRLNQEFFDIANEMI